MGTGKEKYGCVKFMYVLGSVSIARLNYGCMCVYVWKTERDRERQTETPRQQAILLDKKLSSKWMNTLWISGWVPESSYAVSELSAALVLASEGAKQ